MSRPPDDLCPQPPRQPPAAVPHAIPIFPAAVYECADVAAAEAILSGRLPGYAYQRDGHPNAEMLAQRACELHHADWALPASSGMGALAAVVLGQLAAGDHLLVARGSYGRSEQLLHEQCPRFGIEASLVDATDLAQVAGALRPSSRLIFVETLSNPTLRVADIAALAEIAHQGGARLLVDNTFASPVLCQPLTLGADLVLESVSKIINGHSDVILGWVCGRGPRPESIVQALSVWGMCSSPFDCWLASRGLMTLHLRAARSVENAARVAQFLHADAHAAQVRYPGLPSHPDHALAARQLPRGAGWMVTFDLPAGLPGVAVWLAAVPEIPFCPSLGEVGTTISHPGSTSHRGADPEQARAAGIGPGTLRLSVGTESYDWLAARLQAGLDAQRALP